MYAPSKQQKICNSYCCFMPIYCRKINNSSFLICEHQELSSSGGIGHPRCFHFFRKKVPIKMISVCVYT
ncbi:hypothetical protein KUTeg_013628 [Tegillarca granosa]|uniref:Uncharacterized protein n=1 Tax=Tegillarca granosa TaxID=220873 RepID=A0ABQ9EU91_TEGGR|nr:hypothetical protein KUTeg_013628 [Tegillarca granosa]